MMQRLVQLALDLCDAPAAPQAPVMRPAAPAVQPPSTESQVPPVLIHKAHIAPKKIAIEPVPPTVPLSSLLAPAEFRHPRANREVLLGDAVVAYALQRVRRRSIGFTVGMDGLTVRAPTWVTLNAIDAALREKSAWIVRKLAESRERQRRMDCGRIVWAHGGMVPYLGEPMQLVLDPSHGFATQGGALVVQHRLQSAGDVPSAAGPLPGPGSPVNTLLIRLPHSASALQIRDAVQAWLMRDARRHFVARLDHFAPLLGVQWASLRLSSAQTRWGSAKSDGSIRLNWRLLHYRPAIIDYVVAHELAHLRVMDHSPRFWDTVATVVPDYAELRHHLRDEPAPVWS